VIGPMPYFSAAAAPLPPRKKLKKKVPSKKGRAAALSYFGKRKRA